MGNPQFEQLQSLLPLKKSKTGKDVIPSARALYDYLEVKTAFTTWLSRRAEEYGFVEGVDFLSLQEESTGGRPETDAALTVDMAKELGMVEKTEKGRTVRQYFIWAESKLQEVSVSGTPVLPTDFASALRMLADTIEARALLQHQLTEAQPAIDFTKQVAVSTNAVSFSEAAKLLKLKGMEGRTRFVRRLKADKVLRKNREPMQQYVDDGYFEVQAQTYEAGQKGRRVAGTTRVTPRGLTWLAKRYKGA